MQFSGATPESPKASFGTQETQIVRSTNISSFSLSGNPMWLKYGQPNRSLGTVKNPSTTKRGKPPLESMAKGYLEEKNGNVEE
mmetsp:Transcript_28417/g.59353  ORF Transcript_28417/g.59353 Transcript_28417/m.59353 type:complete len:83 (+) Transcript_28417:575-823(+)